MKKIYLPLMGIALLLTLSITVEAAARPKNTFNGSSSQFDSWSFSFNWSLNRVPANGDSIVIKTGQTVFIGDYSQGNSTNTVTISLNNVIVIVQKGATLQIGNGNNGSHNYYGVLNLDNNSVISLEQGGSPYAAGRIIGDNKATTNSANNQINIDGNLKFGGNTNYSSVNGGSTGLVNGPARATINTGTGTQGFSLGSLPVVLVGFNANLADGNKVNIEWTTQQEINSDRFEIQRSNDGLSWETLATVKASGYSSAPKNYSCSDAAPQKGINLYQMKMFDLDGNFGFSPVVNVRLNTLGKISLFPNPSVSQVTVSLSQPPASDWTISLVNMSGQTVIRKQFSKNLTSVNLAVGNYPTGNYTVEIADGSSVQHSKLMITHQ
ncbi:MAG TPA: T9SS type A sorting domain-containing protein [Chitinophagaceae bacterium]|jgi:hypothetical protein